MAWDWPPVKAGGCRILGVKQPLHRQDLRMPITGAQVDRLLTPLIPSRVEKVRGNSYLPQYEARAELSRVFGPTNWDSMIHSVSLVYEEPENRAPADSDKEIFYWRVCYRAACTLRVRDYHGQPLAEYTEYHVEECAPQPNRGEAHALALTSAESYALRRCCINLGDALGLHLYRDGQMSPLVKGSLLFTDKDSPLYRETQPPAPAPTLTAEQRENLKTSLGAVELAPGQETAEMDLPRDAHESAPQP